MESVKCGVQSVEREELRVGSVKCESVECGVESLKWRVQSLEWRVESAKRELRTVGEWGV